MNMYVVFQNCHLDQPPFLQQAIYIYIYIYGRHVYDARFEFPTAFMTNFQVFPDVIPRQLVNTVTIGNILGGLYLQKGDRT